MRRRLTRLPILVLALLATTPGWARASAGDFQLGAPTTTSAGDIVTVRGAVCRRAVGRPGAPLVAVSRRDALDHEISASPIRLTGAARERAGGCAAYVARQVLVPGEHVAICVASSLSGRSPQCVTVAAGS